VPAHAARRRPALPALLLTVAAAALGGLALLPAALPATAASAVLTAQPAPAAALHGETERAAVLARPPITRTVAPARPAARPARAVRTRAARQRVAADVPTGYVCPIRAHTSFTDTWGEPRSGGRRHEGTDVLAAYGAPVVAVISGTIHTDYSSNGGLSLYLRGVDGDEYFYAHNSRNVASDGEHVSTGQLIAYVGTSGNARGGPPHVHFERHPGGGRPVDPYPFLVRACGA
jgi:murein DD-endopeptidase MepM/ murein hydrolase activator NlpD